MKLTRRTKRTARALFRMCLVDGRLDQSSARKVAERLAASHRRGALPALAGFQRLVRLDRDRQSAFVDSAAPLDEALRARLQAGLIRVYGPAVEAVFRVDPALVGGIRIKVGSDVFDDTVRARLASLDALL